MFIPIFTAMCFIAYMLWSRRRHRAALVRAAPAQYRFFEQTGYRLRGSESQPLADQAHEALLFHPGAHHPAFVRPLGGDRLVYHRATGFAVTPAGQRFGCFAWVLELGAPTRVQWSLVRRSLPDDVEPYPVRHPRIALPDDPLGRHHDAFAADATTVSRILATPALQDALLACAVLDLHVERDRVIFMDPGGKNLSAGCGGGLTMMLLGGDIDRQFDLHALAHAQIAALLQQVVALSREEVPRV